RRRRPSPRTSNSASSFWRHTGGWPRTSPSPRCASCPSLYRSLRPKDRSMETTFLAPPFCSLVAVTEVALFLRSTCRPRARSPDTAQYLWERFIEIVISICDSLLKRKVEEEPRADRLTPNLLRVHSGSRHREKERERERDR